MYFLLPNTTHPQIFRQTHQSVQHTNLETTVPQQFSRFPSIPRNSKGQINICLDKVQTSKTTIPSKANRSALRDSPKRASPQPHSARRGRRGKGRTRETTCSGLCARASQNKREDSQAPPLHPRDQV